nr:unnamed protein product [Spirometra erinaceieuropaei]
MPANDLFFAGNFALNNTTEEDMQRSMDFFAYHCANFGPTINTNKRMTAEYSVLHIRVNGAELKAVDNSEYLGSTMSRCIRIDDEVARWIFKASQAYSGLQNFVWNRHSLQMNSKLKTCKAVIPTTLLYGGETWVVYSCHAKKLNHFHLSCLRRILRLRWREMIPDVEVLEWTGFLIIHAMLRQL